MTIDELVAWRYPKKKDRPKDLDAFFENLDVEDQMAAILLGTAVGIEKASDFQSLYFALPVNYEQYLLRRGDLPYAEAVQQLNDFVQRYLNGEANPLEAVLPDEDQRIEELNPYDEYIARTISEDAVCRKVTVPLIKEAMRLGFFPMSSTFCGKSFLQVRFHGIKEIILWSNYHVPHEAAKFVKKYFADCTITCNKAFDAVVEGIKNAYGDTWLTDDLMHCYRQIHEKPGRYVSIDSVEIWRGGTLIAGEIGFVTGNVYASLSGFHTEKHSGTVQMSILGLMLMYSGFLYWDLGMYIPYKERYGAMKCDRMTQQGLWNERQKTRVALPSPDEEHSLMEWVPALEGWIEAQKDRDN